MIQVHTNLLIITSSPQYTDERVCIISTPMQVVPFSTSAMYSFSGLCDHWLLAPSVAANGVEFSVIVNFIDEDLRIGQVIINYGEAQFLSTTTGEAESSITPIDEPTPGMYVFSNNVIVTKMDGVNTVELRDIDIIVTHTYAPEGAENIHILVSDVAKLPGAEGLCGTTDGKLQFGGSNGDLVADITNLVQLRQFSRSWIVPADLQSSSTPQSCSMY